MRSSCEKVAGSRAAGRMGSGMRYRRLARSELPIDTAALARFLIGKAVVRRDVRGRPQRAHRRDRGLCRRRRRRPRLSGRDAPHPFAVSRARARLCLSQPWRSYMLNVSSEAAGVGAGVLIRALEPLEGIAIMQRNRRTERLRDLTRGPWKAGPGPGDRPVGRRSGPLPEGPLWLAHGERDPGEIGQGVRIGLSREAERPLRFYVRGNRSSAAQGRSTPRSAPMEKPLPDIVAPGWMSSSAG
jgi:DNA-3-methyladenine glycosylase